MSQRYFMQLSFKGTNYHGWQVQPNAVSVQKVMEKSLSTLLRDEIPVVGAGRTDTGVHASFFVLHFDSLDSGLDNEKFVFRLNNFLPDDIAVQKIKKVGGDAHARFSALSRTYKYFIVTGKDPFLQDTSVQYNGKFDIEKMNAAAAALLEFEDFTSFARLHSDVKTNNCKIFLAEWNKNGHRLIFTIKADRFLRNMVRAIVGTLLEVGRDKISVDDFRTIIEKKDRSVAGASAPAKGLFLAGIEYPEEIVRF